MQGEESTAYIVKNMYHLKGGAFVLPVRFNIMLSIRLFSVLQRRQIFPFLIFLPFLFQSK